MYNRIGAKFNAQKQEKKECASAGLRRAAHVHCGDRGGIMAV